MASIAAVSLVNVPCPRCGASESKPVATGRDYLYGIPGEFTAAECVRCGLWFQNPRPAETDIGLLYPDAYSPHEAPASSPKVELPRTKGSLPAEQVLPGRTFDRLRSIYRKARSLGRAIRHPARHAYRSFLAAEFGYPLPHGRTSWLFRSSPRLRAGIELIPHARANGRLLEVGCASGGRLTELRALGWQHLTGIEFVPNAAERARAAGFEVLCGDAQQQLERLPDEAFDVVIASMVFEHLVSPFAVIGLISKKLKRGGEFLFSTVVRDSWDAAHFGSYWAGFDFPRHMVFFSLADIREAVRESFTDFEVFFQNAPVDYVRSATWRLPQGRMSDRLLLALPDFMRRLFGRWQARRGKTTRVSFRCVKRDPGVGT